MINPPVISVVVPIYNAMPYLSEALDSLLKQSYPALEIICVNDGSTDNSLEIVKKYSSSDSRIKIIDGMNGGYGCAMNKGLRAASGQYFAILEPDDYIPENTYKTLISLAEKYNLDFIKGRTVSFAENENNGRVFTPAPRYPILHKVICPRKNAASFIGPSMDTWNGIYNLNFLRSHRVQYHESPGASYQDVGFFMQTFSYAERALFIDTPTYYYRTDNTGASSSPANRAKKSHMLREEYEFIRKILSTNVEIWKEIESLYLARRVGGHRWIYDAIPLSLRYEYLSDLRKDFLTMENYDRRNLPWIDKVHFENLLVSVDYFLNSELILSCVWNIEHFMVLANEYRKNKLKVIIYTLLSAISFGKARRKFQAKKKKYRNVTRMTRSIIKRHS